MQRPNGSDKWILCGGRRTWLVDDKLRMRRRGGRVTLVQQSTDQVQHTLPFYEFMFLDVKKTIGARECHPRIPNERKLYQIISGRPGPDPSTRWPGDQDYLVQPRIMTLLHDRI